jgi:NAD(P)-dependent dehydrogenase (short-subunit alcohol dehydrogenase family)
MDTGLKGKNVLITGASRNMGKLAAIQFAQEGANLAICTSSKMRELNAVAEELRALGVKVVATQCDVADLKAVQAFVAEAEAKLGSIDVAINNAVHRAEGPFLEESDEVWLRNIAVNLTGPRNICRAVLPGMMKRQWGRIINFSGIAPFLGHGPA